MNSFTVPPLISMRTSSTFFPLMMLDAAAVPYLDGAREALRDGFVSGGTRRNLDWVRPHASLGVSEDAIFAYP